MVPPTVANEALRLATVEHYRLAGAGRDPEFDHVAQLASQIFDVPVALVSIIGQRRQWFRGAYGLEIEGTAREVAFCNQTILGDGVMVVPDARDDPRFAANPLVVGEPHIRFYAGAILRAGDRQPVGTMCVIGYQPRRFSAQDRKRLSAVALIASDMIDMRAAG